MSDQTWFETLADVRELPATVFVFGEPGPQNVAVRVTLADGSELDGTAVVACSTTDEFGSSPEVSPSEPSGGVSGG